MKFIQKSTLRGLLLMLLILVSGCKRKATQSEEKNLIKVRLGKVENGLIQVSTDHIAVIKSRRSVTLQPHVEGYITQILISPGDQVKEGVPLLRINPAKQEAVVRSYAAASQVAESEKQQALALLASYEADRASKQAKLLLAEQQYERAQRLYVHRLISQQESEMLASQLETAKSELKATEAQLAAQRARILGSEQQIKQSEASAKAEREHLQYFTVSAPFDGTVGDIQVKLGERVESTTTLTTLDQNTMLEAYIHVPAERGGDLKPGIPVKLMESSGEKLLETRVSFVAPQVDPTTQSLLVKAPIPDNEKRLRSGQWVRARLIWSERQGPIVPRTAVLALNDQNFVFVAVKEGERLKVRQRPVRLELIEKDYFPVREGLVGGEQIVVSITPQLADGVAIADGS